MAVRKIDYLEWARRHMDKVKYDLAKSNVKGATMADIGLTLDDVNLHRVDEEGNPELHQMVADRYGVPVDHVLITNGASQGIFLACNAAIERGDEVLLESPNYEPLYRVLLQIGAEPQMLTRRFEQGFQFDLEDVERSISKQTQALVMSNLHNPSGVATNPEKLETLGKIVTDYGAYLICAEAYLDNAFQEGHRPVATYGKRRISIGTLTKIYGFGGLRIGWIVGDPDVVSRAKLMLDYVAGGLPGPSESIACVAMKKREALIARCNNLVKPNLALVREWVQSRKDLKWIEPDGGTVCLVRLARGTDAKELSDHLREKHSTLVVPGDFFYLRGFIRISVGIERATLEAGLKNISAALDELKSGR